MISVGIDISKEKSMICIIRPYGEIVFSPYEVLHTEQEVNKLITRIQSLDGEVRVVMEATGAYHLPLLTSLQQAGIFVSVINPLAMKKYASLTLRKGKTDKLDSVRIANYGIDSWFRLVNHSAPEAIYDELRMLGRQYSHYIALKIKSKLVLSSLLERTMPGIKHLLNNNRPEEPTKDKLSDFVEEYWHYDNIIKKSENCFVNEYNQWSKKNGYYANETKARAIYSVACNSITTLSSNFSSTKILILEAVRVLREINKTLSTILKEMQNLAMALPEYPVVRAMNGVGDVLAPRIIAEIGDVRRFHGSSSLIAFAGIDSPPYQSGSFAGTKRNISKRGSALLRKTGYEIMHCLKSIKPSQDAAVYLYMLKKEAEGKAKKVAKIAALNKFLRIYYARVMEMYQH